jgi:HMG (high mobility group) box
MKHQQETQPQSQLRRSARRRRTRKLQAPLSEAGAPMCCSASLRERRSKSHCQKGSRYACVNSNAAVIASARYLTAIDLKRDGCLCSGAFGATRCNSLLLLQVTEIMKEVAGMWRTLGEEEKQDWAKKAVVDKQRYEDELSKYDGPLKVQLQHLPLKCCMYL